MPFDHLTQRRTADAVLTVLSGAPLNQVASEAGVAPENLADAVRIYHQAGQTALHAWAEHDWYQASLELPPNSSIENTLASHLKPRLHCLEKTGASTSWWFIRKAPGLRLRVTPSNTANTLESLLDELTTAGTLIAWKRTRYEPEEAAFGGHHAMDNAHQLFAADSRHLLDYVQHPQPALGRRELSLLLCTSLFRAAGQEWFECGDIWHRVARHRPQPDNTAQSRHLSTQLQTLLSHDPHPSGPLFGNNGPLHTFTSWAHAFHDTGRTLADLNNRGTLQRGLRSILAHHVIFHWNRFGLNTRTQGILAHTAAARILGSDERIQ